MPKIDFNQPFKDIEGKVIDGKKEVSVWDDKTNNLKVNDEGQPLMYFKELDEPLTLKRVATRCLMNGDPKDESGEKKADYGALAFKIAGSNGEPLELEPSQVESVKALVKKYETPIIVHQVNQFMLEADPK